MLEGKHFRPPFALATWECGGEATTHPPNLRILLLRVILYRFRSRSPFLINTSVSLLPIGAAAALLSATKRTKPEGRSMPRIKLAVGFWWPFRKSSLLVRAELGGLWTQEESGVRLRKMLWIAEAAKLLLWKHINKFDKWR
jgi:hypothetical protein